MTSFSKHLLAAICICILGIYAGHIHALCCGTEVCSVSSRCGDCGEIQPICCNSICHGYPFYLTRSQGRNAARELAGLQNLIHQYGKCSNYGTFYVATEYERSFWPEQITRYLFGADYVDCCNLYIQGSQVANRHEKAWLADYFGLPPDYESCVSFCPQIQNAIVDIDFYIGFDRSVEGLYLNVNLPIAWTKWELNPCETIRTGTRPFPAGYMAEIEIPRSDMLPNFSAYMNGGTFGDYKTPLRYSRFKAGACTETRLAHIRASLGYNFALNEDYHFGVFGQIVLPTGNRPCARQFFEPMVGNGRHVEIGGGMTGSWIIHRSCECEDKYLGAWFNLTLTHLLSTCQCRTFDLICKPNSRYMLLEDMGANLDGIQGGADMIKTTTDTASYQYKRNIIPAANLTTWNVDVRHDVQVDFAAKLGLVHNNWSFDLGYNFWALTGGKFELDCCACRSVGTYAVKGDSCLYGKKQDGTIFPLTATQNLADIYSGKNYPQNSDDKNANLDPAQNLRIDNPRPAMVNDNEKIYSLVLAPNKQINTSVDPKLVTRASVNLDDAPTAITHKVFAHVEYASNDRDCETVIPFIGVGGQVEFAKNKCQTCCSSHKDCDHGCGCGCNHGSGCSCGSCKSSSGCSCGTPSCSGCSHSACNNQKWECDHCCDPSCDKRAGTSQWGIWLKGGLSFD